MLNEKNPEGQDNPNPAVAADSHNKTTKIVMLLFPDYVTIASALCDAPKLYEFFTKLGITDGKEVSRGVKKAGQSGGLKNHLNPFLPGSALEFFSSEAIESEYWGGTIDSIPKIDTSSTLVLLRYSSMQNCSREKLAKKAKELGYIVFYGNSVVRSDGSWGNFEELVAAIQDRIRQ